LIANCALCITSQQWWYTPFRRHKKKLKSEVYKMKMLLYSLQVELKHF
jgi:hypothetical protein